MVMELIDRKALLAEYDRVHIGEPGKARKLIEDAPEAVVHCRDCVHMKNSFNARFCKVWCMYNGMGDEGFCNYGERKEDGKQD